MNVKKTVSEKLKQEFHVIIESDEIKRRVTDSLTSKIKNIKLPGFRPGKVPLHIVRQRFEESTTHEVINDVIQDSSRKVLKENKINPASEPTLELDTYEDGKDLSFRLKVETLPTIELPDFSKVSIKKIKSEVSDKDVEKAVEEHAKSRTFFVPAPEKAKAADSDLIKINLETHVDKNQIKQYTQNDVTIKLGDGRFLFPIIEKELVNKKVGDTFNIEHTFDAATPHKILSGKTANFTITVTSHDVLKSLSVGPEYVKACGFESMDDLKQRFRVDIESALTQNIYLYNKRILLDKLADMYTFDLPESMVKTEFKAIWARLKAEMDDARKNGELSPEDDKSEDVLEKEYQAIAERRVRLGLVISEISQKNGIRLTEKMVQDLIVGEALKYRGQEKQVVEYFRNSREAIETLTSPALEDMVVTFVLDKIDSKEEVLTMTEAHKKFVGVLPGFEEINEKAASEKPKAKAEKKEKAAEDSNETEKPKAKVSDKSESKSAAKPKKD